MRGFWQSGATGLAALMLVASVSVHADTLVDNVNGYTLDEKGKVFRFNGLLMDDDGRVKQLLQPRDKREYAKFKTDGKGRTLLPGMIDSHAKLMAIALAGSKLDLGAAASVAEAQSLLRAFATSRPTARWITGEGWSSNGWSLSAADLDVAVADKPVWLVREDGDAGAANSAALGLAGIGKTTKDPAGGKIGRLPDGRPSGLLTGSAMSLVQTHLPPENPVEREIGLSRALQMLAANGITMIHDVGTSLDDWLLYRRFGDEGRLIIRIYAMADGIGTLERVTPVRRTPWLYGDRLVMQAVRFSADGDFLARRAWLKQPYADAATSGAPLVADARLRNWISRALVTGMQPAVEANGDAAVAQALDAYAEMIPTYGRDRRPRIEGATLVDPVDVTRFEQLGAVVVVRPVQAVAQGVTVDTRLGPARATAVNAWQALERGKAAVAIGSGAPAPGLNPFASIQAAMSGRPGQSLTIEQGFEAQTIGGAKAALAEDRLGSLQKGKWADFIIVDRDMFTIDPSQIGQTEVLETWIAGKRVYVRGARLHL